jgi:hypothetical protein
MSKIFEFETVLRKGPQLGLYADFPFSCETEFGVRKNVPVKVNINGYETEMNLLPIGNRKHSLHLRKEIRDAIGKEEGDLVKIKLEKNDAPFKIQLPDYLQWLFENDPAMMKAFTKSSVSVKKFWVGYIEETNNEEVKVERINNFFRFLQSHYSG